MLYRLQDIHYSYVNQVPALNGISLEIEAGARVALIGSNGSGKSTLLKILDGLYLPQSGTFEFAGSQITEEKLSDESFSFTFRRRVGLLFQDPEVQLFSPTVWDEIVFGPLQLQWNRDELRERAEYVLKQFGLEELRDRTPHRLSGGEKKKVALASVLIIDPEVLLLDEPTASLDPRSQSVLLELLHDWGHKSKTTISSTHDLTILQEICDRVYVMQEGKIVFQGTPQEVLENEQLLQQTNLIHQHTHKHEKVEHRHAHTHDFHGHPHDHD